MNTRTFDYNHFCDEFGPAKVLHIYEPHHQLRAIVVVDNVAIGPAIGGVRMAPDVTAEEVFRLARAMTQKNAAAGLAHGGGKAGILADPKTTDKESLIRSFARAIRDLADYIPGPDMGTDETCMAWVHDEIGRCVGLPRVMGGIPLDEIGATGYGLAECADIATSFCDLQLENAKVAIEGFGNVGRHAANYLARRGCQLIAATDSQGGVYDPKGINVGELSAVKEKSGSVIAYGGGQRISQAELFHLPCDILVPAARPDCIRSDNVVEIQARLILQGANIPATLEAEQILHERGVLVLPDFIANAGGVICGSVEYHGGSEADAFEQIAARIRRNTQQVLRRARDEAVPPRQAAVALARERVLTAMSFRLT